MQLKNNKEHYGAIAKSFHWAMAVLILGLLGLGLYMSDLDPDPFKFKLYMLHKSFGSLVFILAILRVLWRFSNPKPAPLPSHKSWEIKLAHFTHILLYVLIILMPLSGWLMNSAGAFPHPFFGLFNIPPLMGKDESIFRLMRNVHEYSAYGLLGIIGLHFAGALKHWVIDKDRTVQRMWPARPALFFGGVVLIFAVLVYVSGAEKSAAPEVLLPNVSQILNQTEITHLAQEPASVIENSPPQAATIAAVAHKPIPTWNILPQDSAINFTAKVEGTEFEGTFERFRGTIQFDPENLLASYVKIYIDITSVQSGSAERDEYIIAPEWFNTESFPESAFIAENFTKVDENQYVARGDLTIKDVTLPVRLLFTLDIAPDDQGNNIANMTGSASLNRLDFNLGEGRWKNTTTVENQVKVSVSVKAQQQQSAAHQDR